MQAYLIYLFQRTRIVRAIIFRNLSSEDNSQLQRIRNFYVIDELFNHIVISFLLTIL